MSTSETWIVHSLETTPAIITDEDIRAVSPKIISDFYAGLRTLMLLRVGSLPHCVEDSLTNCPAVEFHGRLHTIVNSGTYSGINWVDEWTHAATEISTRLRGYPRKIRKETKLIVAASRAPSGNQVNFEKDAAKDQSPKFRFLDLPMRVRYQVYRYLLVAENIVVCDWSVGRQVKSVKQRTDYEVRVGREFRRTTYQVRTMGKKRGLDLEIMSVNKQIAAESTQVFYGENAFTFLGCTESALAFIHDHGRHFDTVQRVESRYSCNVKIPFIGCSNMTCPIPRVPCTWPHSFRKLANFLVHCCPGLVDFKLIVDRTFWETAPWDPNDPRGSAPNVFLRDNLCEPFWARPSVLNIADANSNGPTFVARNFLQHVARLGGVNITLEIDGCYENAERQRFMMELRKVIVEHTLERPYLAEDAKPDCVCRTRFLMSVVFGIEMGRSGGVDMV